MALPEEHDGEPYQVRGLARAQEARHGAAREILRGRTSDSNGEKKGSGKAGS